MPSVSGQADGQVIRTLFLYMSSTLVDDLEGALCVRYDGRYHACNIGEPALAVLRGVPPVHEMKDCIQILGLAGYMKSLVRTCDDLALISVVGNRISVKSDVQIRIDRENVSLDPCALAADHSCFAIAECCFFSCQIGLEGLVISVCDRQVDEIEEVVVQFRIISNLGFSIFELADQLSSGDACAFSCGIDKVLCHMLEHPPFSKAGGEGLVAGCGDLLAGCDQFLGGLRE